MFSKRSAAVIDGSEKRNGWLNFERQSPHVIERRSKDKTGGTGFVGALGITSILFFQKKNFNERNFIMKSTLGKNNKKLTIF